MLIGSLSFVGIGTMAAVLPLIWVERGAQMTFVLQSVLLLVSGVYYSIEILPRLDAGPRRTSRRPPTSSTGSARRSSTGYRITELLAGHLAAASSWPWS